MKKSNNITCWTDYPFEELGDTPNEEAPIRHVRVMHFDGNKYAIVGFIGVEPKVGHVVMFHPKVFTHRHYVPHYDYLKGPTRHFKVLELCEEEGHYTGHIMLAELVWSTEVGEFVEVPMKHAVHDDEVYVVSDVKCGYLYRKRARYGQSKTVNPDKLNVAFGWDTIARYFAKGGKKIKRHRNGGFTVL